MNWASNRPQNQTMLHLRATTGPNDERGPGSDVSGWEPATTGPPGDWYLYCCQQLGRSIEHCSRPGREPLEREEQMPCSEHWGFLAEICAIWSCQVVKRAWNILVFIFSHFKNMPSIVLFLEPPVQVCRLEMETVLSLFSLLYRSKVLHVISICRLCSRVVIISAV